MEKTIIARCKDKVYADNILLFSRNEELQFTVYPFTAEYPDCDSSPCKVESSFEQIVKTMKTYHRYETKKGMFTFCFYDDELAEAYGLPSFQQGFIQLQMELNAENVDKVFKECLSKEKEGNEVVHVGAVLENAQFAFDKKKLDLYRTEITSWVEQLPDNFQESKGGGWSFLNMAFTKDGRLWTGYHFVMEQLLCLAIGIGKMKYLLERNMWKILPGSMPYVAIVG